MLKDRENQEDVEIEMAEDMYEFNIDEKVLISYFPEFEGTEDAWTYCWTESIEDCHIISDNFETLLLEKDVDVSKYRKLVGFIEGFIKTPDE